MIQKQNIILILDKHDEVVKAFVAPDGDGAVVSLWHFLTENLRPGLSVELWLSERGNFTSPSVAVTPKEKGARRSAR